MNGNPIYYWTNKHDATVPPDAGFVVLVNCTGITSKNLRLSNNYNGMLIVNTHNSSVTENELWGNFEGLRISNSSKNRLENNTVYSYQFNLFADAASSGDVNPSNTLDGKPVHVWIDQHDKTVPEDAGYVALTHCSGIAVQNLNLTNNGIGIYLQDTHNSTIDKNSIAEADCGITLVSSQNNSIINNLITTSRDGIKMENGSDNSIVSNLISDSANSGISLTFSNGTNLQGNMLTGSNKGVLLSDSTNNTLKGNILTANYYGLQFSGSMTVYNLVVRNKVDQNSIGSYMYYTVENNTFFHNNFINNTQQAATQLFGSQPMNTWDNGIQGNYWSNYNGTDNDGDGIGNLPMSVYSQTLPDMYFPGSTAPEQDHYPLMKPYSSP